MMINRERIRIIRQRKLRIIILALILIIFTPIAFFIIFSSYFSAMDISFHTTVVQQLKKVILFERKEDKRDEKNKKKM